MPEHVIFENSVIENKMTELINTKLDVMALMDTTSVLEDNAGLKLTVHKYTYEGKVEKLAKGSRNTTKGKATYVAKDYVVSRYQETYEYFDDDIMQDPYLINVLSEGSAKTIANEIRDEYFNTLKEITQIYEYENSEAFSYATVVDALAKLNVEDTTGYFLIVGNKELAEIRKDPLFTYSNQGAILYSGQVGEICGIPIVLSKKADFGAVITQKKAVRFVPKKTGNVEQERDIETKLNTVVYSRYGVIYLADDTESIIIKQKGE